MNVIRLVNKQNGLCHCVLRKQAFLLSATSSSCVCVCVCYTGVLSLYLHTSSLTWECTLYLRQSSNTHAHTYKSTHMDTTAYNASKLHEPVRGSRRKWHMTLPNLRPQINKKRVFVVHMIIEKWFRQDVWKKAYYYHSHICTNKMSA